MSIHITDDAMMTSDVTRHTARRVSGGWAVSWLPGRVVDRNQATTAMVLAESVAAMQSEGRTTVVDHTHPLWPHLDAWATELGLTGPDAYVRVSDELDLSETEWPR